MQVGEAAQFRRYLTSQFIAPEGQDLQVGETAQFRRYLTAHLISAEGQMSDAPIVVCCNAAPFPDWPVAQAVALVDPVVAVRRVVEGHQRLPVGGRGRFT